MVGCQQVSTCQIVNPHAQLFRETELRAGASNANNKRNNEFCCIFRIKTSKCLIFTQRVYSRMCMYAFVCVCVRYIVCVHTSAHIHIFWVSIDRRLAYKNCAENIYPHSKQLKYTPPTSADVRCGASQTSTGKSWKWWKWRRTVWSVRHRLPSKRIAPLVRTHREKLFFHRRVSRLTVAKR